MTSAPVVHPQREYFETLQGVVRPGMRWLDVGCGHQTLLSWVATEPEIAAILEGVHLAGLDVDPSIHQHPHLAERLIGTVEHIPAPDRSYDLVTMNMVMEHLQEPEVALREIARVLRPGGCCIIHTPNRRYWLIRIARWVPQGIKHRIIWWLERRREEDVFPTYYRGNSPEELTVHASRAGLVIRVLQVTGPYPAFLRTWLAPLEGVVLRVIRSGYGHRSNIIAVLRRRDDTGPHDPQPCQPSAPLR